MYLKEAKKDRVRENTEDGLNRLTPRVVNWVPRTYSDLSGVSPPLDLIPSRVAVFLNQSAPPNAHPQPPHPSTK